MRSFNSKTFDVHGLEVWISQAGGSEMGGSQVQGLEPRIWRDGSSSTVQMFSEDVPRGVIFRGGNAEEVFPKPGCLNG